MKRAIVWVVVVLVVAGAAAGGWWYLDRNPEWLAWARAQADAAAARLGLAAAEEPGLVASGFIEAREVAVTTDLGGRILEIAADEGDEVEAGAELVRLDDALLQAQIASAEADLAAAQAALAQVRAGVRQETIDHALAQLEQARLAQEAARVAWEDAQAIADNPQELALALAAVQAQADVLSLQERQAQAMAASAQTAADLADESVRLMEEFDPYREWVEIGSWDLCCVPQWLPIPPGLGNGEHTIGDYKVVVADGQITVYTNVRIAVPSDIMQEARYQQARTVYQAWTAWTGAAQAEAARQGTDAYAAALAEQVANPLALQARANAARAQYEIATAAVSLANAQVEGLQMGATREQVAAVEAQVAMAQAALGALEVQAGKFRLGAPIAGLVLERAAQVGEVAIPGAPLLTIGNLDSLVLTVYVAQNELGRVYPGLPVSVTVDAYPGRAFPGTVRYVAGEAEFTPRNIQAREERVNMVFAVEIDLPNPDHALKPGMPADAVLGGVGSWGLGIRELGIGYRVSGLSGKSEAVGASGTM